MRYEKPAQTFEQQADLLLSRGLVASRDELIRRLKVTSYFRLIGYLRPFRLGGSEEFEPGTTLEKVWQLYAFDQRLRTLLLDVSGHFKMHHLWSLQSAPPLAGIF